MVKHIYIILFITTLCIELNAQASKFSHEKLIGRKGDTLNYRQLISDYETQSKFPLVIFLHGSGERGNDNEAQLKWGVQHFATDQIMHTYRPIVIAAQCPEKMRWGNFSSKGTSINKSPSQPMTLLIELIKEKIQSMPIDTNRIYITGLSMGGFGTFDALSRYPNMFAAAVPVCGGGDVSKAKLMAHIPIWIFHGMLDDVVDPSSSLKMHKALNKHGANPGLTLYPNTGHFSWLAAYTDKKMMDWLFQQRKSY